MIEKILLLIMSVEGFSILKRKQITVWITHINYLYRRLRYLTILET